MNCLLLWSKEEQMPIELIYLSNKGEISQRKVVIRNVQGDYIQVYCLLKKQPRLLKKVNILSAAKPKVKEKYYA